MVQTEQMTAEQLAKEYPGIPEAAKLVASSYQIDLQRLDRIDDRIQWFMGLIAGTTAGVPAFASNAIGPPAFSEGLFLAACVLFAIAFGVGLFARSNGSVRVLDVERLYVHHLDQKPVELQRTLLHTAGEDGAHNTALVWSKNRALDWMTGLFLLEVLFLVAWIARA